MSSPLIPQNIGKLFPGPLAPFYEAFVGGDLDGMLRCLSPNIRVRFPSYPIVEGIEHARLFFEFQGTLFQQLDFHLVDVVVSGNLAAVVWTEEGTTSSGSPWMCHGVDLVLYDSGLITEIEVGGSPGPLLTELPRYHYVQTTSERDEQ